MNHINNTAGHNSGSTLLQQDNTSHLSQVFLSTVANANSLPSLMPGAQFTTSPTIAAIPPAPRQVSSINAPTLSSSFVLNNDPTVSMSAGPRRGKKNGNGSLPCQSIPVCQSQMTLPTDVLTNSSINSTTAQPVMQTPSMNSPSLTMPSANMNLVSMASNCTTTATTTTAPVTSASATTSTTGTANGTSLMPPPSIGRYHHLLRLSSLECMCEDGSWRLVHSSGSVATVASIMSSWKESLVGPVCATFHVEMLMNSERQSWCVAVLFNWVDREKPIPVPRVLNLRDKPRVEYNLRFTMATMLEALRQNEAPRLQLNTDYHFHPCPVRLGNIYAIRVPMTEPGDESVAGLPSLPPGHPSPSPISHIHQRVQQVSRNESDPSMLCDSNSCAVPGASMTSRAHNTIPSQEPYSWTDEQLLHELHERIANRDHGTIVLTFNRSPIDAQEPTYRLFDIPRGSLFAGIYEKDGRLRHIMKQGRALPLLIGQDTNPELSPRFFQAPTQGAAVINPLGVIKQLDTPHIILPVTDTLGHTLWVNELPLDCALNDQIPLAAKDKYLLIWEQLKKDMKKINQNVLRYAAQQQPQPASTTSTASVVASQPVPTSSSQPPPSSNPPSVPTTTSPPPNIQRNIGTSSSALVSVASSRCSSPPGMMHDFIQALPPNYLQSSSGVGAVIEQLVSLPDSHRPSSAISSRPLSPVAAPSLLASIGEQTSPPLTFQQLPPYLRDALVGGQMSLQQITQAMQHSTGFVPMGTGLQQLDPVRNLSIASLPSIPLYQQQRLSSVPSRQMSLHAVEPLTAAHQSSNSYSHMSAGLVKMQAGQDNSSSLLVASTSQTSSGKDQDVTPTGSVETVNNLSMVPNQMSSSLESTSTLNLSEHAIPNVSNNPSDQTWHESQRLGAYPSAMILDGSMTRMPTSAFTSVNLNANVNSNSGSVGVRNIPYQPTSTNSTNQFPLGLSLDDQTSRNLLQDYLLSQSHLQASQQSCYTCPSVSSLSLTTTTATVPNNSYDANNLAAATYLSHSRTTPLAQQQQQQQQQQQHPLATNLFTSTSGNQPPTYWHRDETVGGLPMGNNGAQIIHAPYASYSAMHSGGGPMQSGHNIGPSTMPGQGASGTMSHVLPGSLAGVRFGTSLQGPNPLTLNPYGGTSQAQSSSMEHLMMGMPAASAAVAYGAQPGSHIQTGGSIFQGGQHLFAINASGGMSSHATSETCVSSLKTGAAPQSNQATRVLPYCQVQPNPNLGPNQFSAIMDTNNPSNAGIDTTLSRPLPQ